MDELEEEQPGDRGPDEQHQLPSQLKGHYKQRENSKPPSSRKSSKERVTSTNPPTHIVGEEPVPLGEGNPAALVVRALVVRALIARVVIVHDILDVRDIVIVIVLDGGLGARLLGSLDHAEDLEDLIHGCGAVNLERKEYT